MDYQAVEEVVRTGYREAAPNYRRDDEIEVTTKHHLHLSSILQDICLSFARPIRVLDVGCGTGRYFHCLANVESLTGIDISEDMLAAAQNPVHAHSVTVKQIQLFRANAYLCTFPPASYDFIYSLGMFGHGCPVSVEVCNKFHNWLAPGGKLFFSTIDTRGLALKYRVRRRVRNLIYPVLPSATKAQLDERERRSPFFCLTKSQLSEILSQTQFKDFSITSRVCESPLWQGRHLECLATKTP